MTIVELREKRAKLWATMEGFLDTHRNEIAEILGAEILKRYYYQRGQIIDALKYDETIDKVAEILAKNGEYEKILNIAKTASKRNTTAKKKKK